MELSAKQLRAIERECRAQAREMVKEAYQKYDEVWAGRIRIDAQLLRHGQEVVNDINRKMPNFLVHDQHYCSVDEIADMYGFESENELIDWLQVYTPRGELESRLYEKLLDQALGTEEETPEVHDPEVCDYDIVPF